MSGSKDDGFNKSGEAKGTKGGKPDRTVRDEFADAARKIRDQIRGN